MNLNKKLFLLLPLVAGVLLITIGTGRGSAQEKIQHEVAVDRMLIPVFAFDSKGNPVQDISMEELELYINGKPVPISSFNRILFKHDVETTKKKAGKSKKIPSTPQINPQERIVILIFDNMYTSFYGIKRSKKVAKRLFESKNLGKFVLLEHSMFGGLKLLGGPEDDPKKLKKFMKKLSRLPTREARSDSFDASSRHDGFDPQNDFGKLQRYEERKHQKLQVKFFVDFLAKLKYTLESINQPKIVFLLSEGFSEILFFEADPSIEYSLKYDADIPLRIQKLVKEINSGGSLIYSVYTGRIKTYKKLFNFAAPRKDNQIHGQKGEMIVVNWNDLGVTLDDMDIPIARLSGVESMKSIAVGSGGQYIEGDVDGMVKTIQQTTSAYYELAFTPTDNMGKNLKIKLKCKREGVNVNSLAQTKTRLDYKDLEKIQKKILAMNVVIKRNWIYNLGKTQIAAFKWTDNQKKRFTVQLPEEMKGRKLDFFMLHFDLSLKNPDIKMKSRVISDTEALDIDRKNHPVPGYSYFVIIDPETKNCIFNKLI
jgi:VWFA-related protein